MKNYPIRKMLISIVLLLALPVTAFAAGKPPIETSNKYPVGVAETVAETAVQTSDANYVQTSDVSVSAVQTSDASYVQTAEISYAETGIATEEPIEEPISEGVAANISMDYTLVSVGKICSAYKADKKTKLFNLQANDSVIAFQLNPQDTWTAVVVKGGKNSAESLAYIHTSMLKKDTSGKTAMGEISDDAQFCIVSNEKASYYLFANPNLKGQKTGVLRKGTLLPVVGLDI